MRPLLFWQCVSGFVLFLAHLHLAGHVGLAIDKMHCVLIESVEFVMFLVLSFLIVLCSSVYNEVRVLFAVHNTLNHFFVCVSKEWNSGRAGSLLAGGSIAVEPQEPQAKRVREWWAQHGKGQNLSALSNKGGGIGGAARNAQHLSLSEMRQAAERLGSQPEMYNMVARLTL